VIGEPIERDLRRDDMTIIASATNDTKRASQRSSERSTMLA
jgi:hypothetical protein